MTFDTQAPVASVYPTERLVAVAGDWHGDAEYAVARITDAARRGARLLLHVGDFGLWPGVRAAMFLREVDKTAQGLGIRILVAPGNHEDWGRIGTKRATDRGDGLGAVKWFGDAVAFAPRGHRITLRADGCPDRTVLLLGGAPSVDFEHRTPRVDWWPGEMITDADVAHAAAGGFADIMITHDSPDDPYWVPQVAHICATNPMGFSLTALGYAAVGRRRLNAAYTQVRPTVLFHGHYHVSGSVELTHPDGSPARIHSLHKNRHAGNLELFDLADLQLVR